MSEPTGPRGLVAMSCYAEETELECLCGARVHTSIAHVRSDAMHTWIAHAEPTCRPFRELKPERFLEWLVLGWCAVRGYKAPPMS